MGRRACSSFLSKRKISLRFKSQGFFLMVNSDVFATQIYLIDCAILPSFGLLCDFVNVGNLQFPLQRNYFQCDSRCDSFGENPLKVDHRFYKNVNIRVFFSASIQFIELRKNKQKFNSFIYTWNFLFDIIDVITITGDQKYASRSDYCCLRLFIYLIFVILPK